MKGIRVLFVLVFIIVMVVTISGCAEEIASFTYQGVLVEGYDPFRHCPSPEFAEKVKQEKVVLTRSEVKTIKRCIRLFHDHGLGYLLKLTNKLVVVECPFSFADKPQSTIYIDKEKIKPHITLGNDWDYKLIQYGFFKNYHFRGRPELPNLFRLMLHELGHLVEYKELQFSWKGYFVANELNHDFVRVSWDEEHSWRDREFIHEKINAVESEEELIQFFQWFKENSSFFSVYSSTGMNEDFAEAFVYYYLRKHMDFTLDLLFQDETVVQDLQKMNYSREKKLKFIETVMEAIKERSDNNGRK